ncbi:MAG: flagellar hook-associated protein FlgK [Alphaproteobacteria bacterium]|nr:flagellar hook-associated protein FlgK [Alphaproteobacteria bacterium]
MGSVGSISIALKNAVSGLQVTQSSLETVSNNIANVNNPDYNRKTVIQTSRVLAGRGAGVQVSSIRREVDTFLITELRNNLSILGNFEELNNFYTRMQNMFGSVLDDASISRAIAEISSTMEDYSLAPEGLSQQLNVVSAATEFTRQINQMSSDLQDLRLRADREIADAVIVINEQATIVNNLNAQIARNIAIDLPAGELEDQRDAAIDKIAELMDVTTFTRASGEVVVLTPTGRALIDREVQTLTHLAASSMDAGVTFAIGGIAGITFADGTDITTEIAGGSLAALIFMRDTRITELSSELDQLAGVMRTEINAVHNQGSAFPPPNTLTGTHTFSASDIIGATGSINGTVRIAVVDETGAYSDNGSTAPDYIDIDLAALTSASGGTLTVQNFLDAINSGTNVTGFSGLTDATASLNSTGKLEIKATTATDGIVIDGTGVDGSFGTGGTVSVANVTITAGAITAFPATTISLATESISQAAGDKVTSLLTNGVLNLNISTTAGSPGTVVLTADSNFAFGTVGGAAGNAIGDPVSTASADLAAGGTVEVAVDSTGDGNADTVVGTITFPAITLNNPTSAGAQGNIAISGISHTRDATMAIASESLGVSDFFGLNDFFVTDENYSDFMSEAQTTSTFVPSAAGTLTFRGSFGSTTVAYTAAQTITEIATAITANSTLSGQNISASVISEGDNSRLQITDSDGNNFLLTDSSTLLSSIGIIVNNQNDGGNISVRSSLANDSSLIARGELSTATPALNSNVLAAGDNSVALAMAAKFTSNLAFQRAGSQSPTNNTLSGYASSILGLNAIQADSAKSQFTFRNTLVESLKATEGQISGVNIDEELANMVILQNAYNASARVIQVTSELLDVLIDMV